MGLFKALTGSKSVFPETITNEFINSMSRVELTEDQRRKSYSKYYYKDMEKIPQADLDIVNAGPIETKKAIPLSRAAELLNDGYLDEETGYCLMEDGTGLAATKVFMPGVTPEMIDWWFNWHVLDGLRYMIWCPVAHTGISAKTPEAHKDSSGVPLNERNVEKIHYPIEGFNVEGAVKVEIAFRKPDVFGITQEMIDKSTLATYQIATCTIAYIRLPINVFFHAIREVEGGMEFRSRYWMSNVVRDGKAQKSRLKVPEATVLNGARSNCIHSLTEYNNLASFLPQLYHEMEGKI